MEWILYGLARALIGFIQALPLRAVARLGRFGGGVAYYLDARHRKVACRNLTEAFGGTHSPAQIRSLAIENFRRIGESYACGIKTAGMTLEELRPHVTFDLGDRSDWLRSVAGGSFVAAIGHFGNFEVFARFGQFVPPFKVATTYRGLKQESLNKLLQKLRSQSGCLFFERRSQANELKQAMGAQKLALGLLADQNAGDRGLRLPFFGRDCSTSAAPALFALRYACPLCTAICYRTGLGQWRIELGHEIPTHQDGRPRSVEDLTRAVNAAFEAAIRRDPANWFWVHNRWKKPGRTAPSASQPPSN